MLDIPQNLIPLKNLLNDDGVWCWTCRLRMQDGETHRFVKNTENFYLGESDYVAAGCVGHWKLNDNRANTVVKDFSGNNNHGTAQQNTSLMHVDGKINGALSGNGSTDYVSFVHSEKHNWGSGDGMVAFWFRRDGNPSAREHFLIKGSSGAGRKRYQVFVEANGKIGFGIDDDTIAKGINSDNDYCDNDLHFVVAMRDGNYLRLFVDNSEDATPVDITGYGNIDDVLGLTLFATNSGDTQGAGELFGGELDNVTIFNRALNEAERTWLWNKGRGTERIPVKYKPLHFKISPRKFVANGQIVTATVSISDVTRLIIDDLERLEGATDAEITFTFVNTKEPAEDYTSLTYTYDVLETDYDEKTVVLEIGAPSPLRERYPADRYYSDLCSYWLRDPITKEIDPRCNYQPQDIEDIILSGTNPVQIQVTNHPYKNGDEVYLGDEEIGGTVELNGNEYTVTVIDSNNIIIDGTDSSEYSTFTSGGTIGHLDCPRNYRACDERNNLDTGQYGGEFGMLPGGIQFA